MNDNPHLPPEAFEAARTISTTRRIMLPVVDFVMLGLLIVGPVILLIEHSAASGLALYVTATLPLLAFSVLNHWLNAKHELTVSSWLLRIRCLPMKPPPDVPLAARLLEATLLPIRLSATQEYLLVPLSWRAGDTQGAGGESQA